ncbi:MAG: DUF5908 family protein [Cyclobacteriaceae bacterium]
MPIEIRELYIKVHVQDAEALPSNSGPSSEVPPNQINNIVAECVEQVLTILKEKQER